MGHRTTVGHARGIRLLVSCLVPGIGLLASLTGTSATALPRMALIAGSPCATCHVQPQGGGLRNGMGFTTGRDTAMVSWSKLGLNALDRGSPSFGSERVRLGADLRSVLARLGAPKPGVAGDKGARFLPDYIVVPMQLMPYGQLKLGDNIDLVGSYNVATLQRAYPGQPTWEAAVQWHGDPMLPVIRAGMIQPTFGIRHDDHTILIRANPSNPRGPYIPPNYADPGVEATWQPRSWFRTEVGGFVAMNLSESIKGDVRRDDVAYSARVTFLPQWHLGGTAGPPAPDEVGLDDEDDDFGEDDEAPSGGGLTGSVNTWLGASAFGTRHFGMQNAFVGVGMSDLASLMFEAATIQRGGSLSGLNVTAMLSVRAFADWLYLNARFGQATATDDSRGKDWKTTQYVVGFEWFPLPYLDIRPELRVLKTDDYLMRHYTFQFHLGF